MQRTALFGVGSSLRWLRATACTVACMAAAAPGLAQQEPAQLAPDGGEALVLALGPTLPGDPSKLQRGLSLDVRPSLASPGLAPDATEVGLKWRQPFGTRGNAVDFAAWRRSSQQTDALSLIQQRDPLFGARVEFKLASKTPFTTDYRFVGLQLDSGARIGIRRSNGNPTIYYRARF